MDLSTASLDLLRQLHTAAECKKPVSLFGYAVYVVRQRQPGTGPAGMIALGTDTDSLNLVDFPAAQPTLVNWLSRGCTAFIRVDADLFYTLKPVVQSAALCEVECQLRKVTLPGMDVTVSDVVGTAKSLTATVTVTRPGKSSTYSLSIFHDKDGRIDAVAVPINDAQYYIVKCDAPATLDLQAIVKDLVEVFG